MSRMRSTSQSRPVRTYYFGEDDSKRRTSQPLKSALKSRSPQRSSNYEHRSNDRFDVS